MGLNHILKTCMVGMVAVLMQACGSTADPVVAPTENSHVKTKIPPPFPITTQLLREERMDKLLIDLVKESRIPGASILIYEGNEETYFGATGYSDIEAKTLLKRSDVGRYYSMTKPIVGVAMMMLYEQGKFTLDDPIAKYLPEFSEMVVYDGENADGSMKLTPAKTQITIRDLMRHTSGLTYGLLKTPIDQMYNEQNVLTYDQTLTQFSERIAKLPLLYQPATQFNYSVSVSIQGRLIEVLSEQSLGTFLEENIFTPLGMQHTGFKVKEKDRAKFTPVHGVGKDGLFPFDDTIARGLFGRPVDEPFLGDLPFESGGGGLVSSIDDYAKFALMLQRNDGTLLKPETLVLMTTDQLGTTPKDQLTAGSSFGFNVAIKTLPLNEGGYHMPEGAFYWGGLAGTFFFVDEKNNLTFLIHMQVFADDPRKLRSRVFNAIYGIRQ